MTAFRSDQHQQHGSMLPKKSAHHVGIVVKDIQVTARYWTQLLGIEKIPDVFMAVGHKDNPSHYRGNPTKATAKLMFFELENLQIELIEPIGDAPSHWKEFLERKGGGVHHLAFEVEGLGEIYIDKFNENGFPLVQHGGWDGGEYGYFDVLDSLGVTLELLERYE